MATAKSFSLTNNIETQTWSAALTRSIPLIYGMFVKRGIHPGLAEELTQKTVFDAVRGRTAYDPERGQLEQWLVGIARKNLAQELRRRATQARTDSNLVDYADDLDRIPLPDQLLEKQETIQQVHIALGRIPVRERRVLELKYLQDLAVREIANQMALTEKAVHSLLYRARQSLREQIQAWNPHEKDSNL